MDGDKAANRTLRMYSRCANREHFGEGSTVVFGMNLDARYPAALEFQTALRGPRTDFVLSGALGGAFLRLNGEALAVGPGGQLPTLTGAGNPGGAPLEGLFSAVGALLRSRGSSLLEGLFSAVGALLRSRGSSPPLGLFLAAGVHNSVHSLVSCC